MEPIAIVKKRSQVWLILMALIVGALLVVAALWFMGDGVTSDVSQILRIDIRESPRTFLFT